MRLGRPLHPNLIDLETLASARQQWTETLDGARGLGVEWRGSRFETYLAIIDELIQLEVRRKTDPGAFADFRRDLRRQELLFEAASQMIQLRLSSSVWGRLDRSILARKLRKVTSGLPLPPTVNGASDGADESRDTLVELLAAALMAESGFEPELTKTGEDVRFHLAGRPTIVAECKRPLSKETLPTTLSKLRKQFWDRKRKGATLCMPIIAVERIEPFESILMKAESAKVLDGEVDRRIDEAIKEIRRISAEIPRHGLGTLSPVGMVTFCGAALVRQPMTHVDQFTTRKGFDTGPEENAPRWLVEQLRHSAGLLADFAPRRA